MKILESAPNRYDKAIRILTFGKLEKTYDHLAGYIEKDKTVLDIGCGTGALTLRAAKKGAEVKGIDVNAQMLEIAQKKITKAGLMGHVKLYEMGVAELGDENPNSYDFVVSGLCFSELTEDELIYAISESKRVLKPGGLLLVADEVKPKGLLKKIINYMIRLPLALITYLITQNTIKALDDLTRKVERSGLLIKTIKLNKMENFMELVAMKDRD